MIEFHRLLLGDTLRNDVFVEALKKVIVPGETVLADIGSGTGYLSFVASKLGAKECHLYEVDEEMLKLSREIARANGITNCVFHEGHSTQIKKPEPVDVVISETLGNYALEENIIETLRDAQRFLKPEGTVIPQKLTQYVAPVISDRLHKELDVWELGQGLDFSAAKSLCFNNIYVRTFRPADVLPDGAQVWDQIDFREDNKSIREATMNWTMASTTNVYGFAVWWECVLLPGISLSTSPAEPKTHWEQIYFPLSDPFQVKKGQKLQVKLSSDSRYDVKIHLAWETAVFDAEGKKLKSVQQDMSKGYVS